MNRNIPFSTDKKKNSQKNKQNNKTPYFGEL